MGLFRSFLEGFNVMPLVSRTPRDAYEHAKSERKRVPELEELIAKDPNTAHDYAVDVIKGPFPLGEAAIATDATSSYYYAKEVIKGPFPLGEAAIAKNPRCAYYYARDIIKGPFPLGEAAIAKDPEFLELYEEFLDSLGEKLPDSMIEK